MLDGTGILAVARIKEKRDIKCISSAESGPRERTALNSCNAFLWNLPCLRSLFKNVRKIFQFQEKALYIYERLGDKQFNTSVG